MSNQLVLIENVFSGKIIVSIGVGSYVRPCRQAYLSDHADRPKYHTM